MTLFIVYFSYDHQVSEEFLRPITLRHDHLMKQLVKAARQWYVYPSIYVNWIYEFNEQKIVKNYTDQLFVIFVMASQYIP